MDRKEVSDYDALINVLRNMEDTLDQLCSDGKKLGVEAESAAATLRDRIAQKNINALTEMSEMVQTQTSNGKELVSSFKGEMEKEKDRVESLLG